MTDRELDALVAEKVMGLKPIEAVYGPYFQYQEDCGAVRNAKAYCSSISAAWEVVERMIIFGAAYCIEKHHLAEEPTVWFISKENMKEGIQPIDEMESCSSTSYTVPRAICKAALLACGVKIDEI